MEALFGDLLRLPCWYCKYYYSTASDCLKRQNEVVEEGCKLSRCDRMVPDREQIQLGMKAYFDYLDAVRQKK